MNIVKVKDLSKSYGKIPAVVDLSFTVEGGEILGLIGPNGAGKSSTIKIILDFMRPDSGEVEVFGRKVLPGQLIHADKHGFLAIPEEDEARLLEAARFMDTNECRTVIAAARSSAGKSFEQILAALNEAGSAFDKAALKKFGKQGEWK